MKVKVPHREAELRSAFMEVFKQLLPSNKWLAIRHEDIRQCGTPDLSVTGHGKTTWWEFKHATPQVTSYGLQELICHRLAHFGYCRYIVYYEEDMKRETRIVHPDDFSTLTPEICRQGFDHIWAVKQVFRAHAEATL